MSVASVGELQRAWVAAQAGHFRTPTTIATTTDRAAAHVGTCPTDAGEGPTRVRWEPGGPVLPVLGAHGSAGATTLSVALATATGGPAGVVETCSATATGLAACATAELGTSGQGWARGTRGDVVLQHRSDQVACPQDLPVPRPWDVRGALSVLDAAGEPGHLFTTGGWVTRTVREAPAVVVVSTATVPGLRRLEAVLHLLDRETAGQDQARLVAVLGPARRRWPRQVAHSTGTRTAGVVAAGRLVPVPHDASLAVRGLDGSDLPPTVVAAATRLLGLIDLDHPTTHSEGTHS